MSAIWLQDQRVDLAVRPMFGLRVFESPYLMRASDTPVSVRRSWRERLFTRPWRPFQAVRVEYPQEPYAIKLADGTIMAHPIIARRLRAELAGVNGDGHV